MDLQLNRRRATAICNLFEKVPGEKHHHRLDRLAQIWDGLESGATMMGILKAQEEPKARPVKIAPKPAGKGKFRVVLALGDAKWNIHNEDKININAHSSDVMVFEYGTEAALDAFLLATKHGEFAMEVGVAAVLESRNEFLAFIEAYEAFSGHESWDVIAVDRGGVGERDPFFVALDVNPELGFVEWYNAQVADEGDDLEARIVALARQFNPSVDPQDAREIAAEMIAAWATIAHLYVDKFIGVYESVDVFVADHAKADGVPVEEMRERMSKETFALTINGSREGSGKYVAMFSYKA